VSRLINAAEPNFFLSRTNFSAPNWIYIGRNPNCASVRSERRKPLSAFLPFFGLFFLGETAAGAEGAGPLNSLRGREKIKFEHLDKTKDLAPKDGKLALVRGARRDPFAKHVIKVADLVGNQVQLAGEVLDLRFGAAIYIEVQFAA
jgi:hypothetical protein